MNSHSRVEYSFFLRSLWPYVLYRARERYRERNVYDGRALAQFRAPIRRVVGNLSLLQHPSTIFFSSIPLPSFSTLEDFFFLGISLELSRLTRTKLLLYSPL